MSFRVGFGFDVHQFAENRKLRLGGIDIPYHKGLAGHSDADVIIHALCDALLGAAGMQDIGFHFPDSDHHYKNIDSSILLKQVVSMLAEKNYRVGNVDVTLCMEKPKISPFVPAMKTTLSSFMGISEDALSIKATTNERMGFIGREEGVAAYAVALINSL